MRLENILALTHGKVLNEPSVVEFANVVFEIKALKRGDLFVAFDENAINEAILGGAYGIMFEKKAQISDSEIAWIKVENLEESLKRLLRFRLIDKGLRVYESDEIVLKLALQLLCEPNFLALHGDVRAVFKKLWNLENGSFVLFCPALVCADIFTATSALPTQSSLKINILEQTLFETSFIYDDVFYERQLISPFFMPYLEILFHFLRMHKIDFRLKKFSPIDHFEPIFTNKNFQIKEFGTSDKVLIFEKSSDFLERQIAFLQTEAPWAKLLYVVPQSLQPLYEETNVTLVFYNQRSEIIGLLQGSDFHFALIVGADKSLLEKPSKGYRQLTLDI